MEKLRQKEAEKAAAAKRKADDEAKAKEKAEDKVSSVAECGIGLFVSISFRSPLNTNLSPPGPLRHLHLFSLPDPISLGFAL